MLENGLVLGGLHIKHYMGHEVAVTTTKHFTNRPWYLGLYLPSFSLLISKWVRCISGDKPASFCVVSQDICPNGKENTIDPENIKNFGWRRKQLWRRIVYCKMRGCYTQKFDSFVWTFGMTKMPRIFSLLPLFKFSEIYDSGTLYDFPERQLCDTWLSLARTFAVTPLNTLTLLTPSTPSPAVLNWSKT